jgi:hypothetical protein
VAWYRCHYAPRAGGAYDSHHWTAGIAGCTRRRGIFEFRWAERVEQLPELAAELVRMNVDIILAVSSTFVEPARLSPLQTV